MSNTAPHSALIVVKPELKNDDLQPKLNVPTGGERANSWEDRPQIGTMKQIDHATDQSVDVDSNQLPTLSPTITASAPPLTIEQIFSQPVDATAQTPPELNLVPQAMSEAPEALQQSPTKIASQMTSVTSGIEQQAASGLTGYRSDQVEMRDPLNTSASASRPEFRIVPPTETIAKKPEILPVEPVLRVVHSETDQSGEGQQSHITQLRTPSTPTRGTPASQVTAIDAAQTSPDTVIEDPSKNEIPQAEFADSASSKLLHIVRKANPFDPYGQNNPRETGDWNKLTAQRSAEKQRQTA